MSIQHPFRAAISTTSLLLAACGPAIRTARDEAIPIPQGATWAWGPREGMLRTAQPRARGPQVYQPRAYEPRADEPRADEPQDPRGPAVPGDEIVLQRFQRAVGAAMLAKGFHQVETPADADFLLTVGFRAGDAPGLRSSTGIGIGIGIGGMWGGRGRRGWYAPWGGPWGPRPWGSGWMYVPWGWSPWYGPWGWGQVPMGGYGRPMAYREGALLAMLRQRSTGYLAWRGQVATDSFAAGHLTQERMNALVAKLFRKLP